MRALVTILVSFILALGILGAALTLLHSLPRKTRPLDPGLQMTQPAGMEVLPRALESVKKSDPLAKQVHAREASYERESEGSLTLGGKIDIPPEKAIGIELLREDGVNGLFVRRKALGRQREFRFERLPKGSYRLKVSEQETGRILLLQKVRLEGDRDLSLQPLDANLVQEIHFAPQEGALEEGAVLVLEDGRFFHQRIRGKAGGRFAAKGLPMGRLDYRIRGRLDPRSAKLTWKGSLTHFTVGNAEMLEIRMGPPDKDPADR